MITPISSYQTNTTFSASMKAPKLKRSGQKLSVLNEKQNKIKEFGAKIKKEYENLDEESKGYLFKSIALLAFIIGAVTYISYIINALMDKINHLFE